MNSLIYNNRKTLSALALAAVLGSSVLMGGCKRSFLEPDPLSFYEPETTFNTESGLKAALAISDRHIRSYWTNTSANTNSVVIGTEYMFSDLAVYGKTDVDGNSVNFNFADGLKPTGGAAGPGGNDGNYINHYWDETYSGIKYANTVLSYVDKVAGLSEATKNTYKGRAYFHRAYRYMALVFQYGDVPLVTKILEVPKQNYHSTKKAAILDMITQDMEFAVQWVPEQKDMTYIGTVNKGACRMLLAKCYLATGQWQKAKDQLDILINQSGYALMQNTFGTFNAGGESRTWNITRNVIWDLHRCENKLIAANTEVIMGMPNRGAQSNIAFATMRIFGPLYNSSSVKAPDGVNALDLYARNSSNYRSDLDYGRALGRGIGTFRPTPFAQKALWFVNGVEDNDDLRHNTSVGNWAKMTALKYGTSNTTYRGQNLRLYHPTTNALLCVDTIRCWFDWPHYKIFITDAEAEANQAANAYTGATKGSNGDWYLYRLAEAYLLRAEAKFYLGDATAKDDVNEIRKRAKCTQLYTTNVTIGDIMNERARELYLEEWRHMELSRVSYCLALSGKSDEWGNTYDVNTYDKASGTDQAGGSYWYKRVLAGGLYNKGGVNSNNRLLNYKMDKCNLYWPIPNAAITANNQGELSQNFGYDGYNPSVKKWDTWQEAVADEDKVK
ncbi:RagB/SusD family nutrient uptake outer membrane protein [Filimonas effusa]|uniref:RagB/SusD family nutrient uptake outer membrane protein n=1 Tax=Filimonas effusa TaxID=2508721 RepID=A0A4Q1DB63_9BACT|nr:RagB/SusD family nutrient uptake outer membrane protein [Filimonas effusa]RXK86015.1 RagB/SusD family nutrient uptake outer membrane protein [Filimonas effusa]